MSEEFICPICGEAQQNKRSLALHMWNKHKIKYSEYNANKQDTALNESKFSEGLIKPSIVKEAKEFVNEKPAAVIDKSLLKETERRDTDFVKAYTNPYKDMYPADGQVLNEWLR